MAYRKQWWAFISRIIEKVEKKPFSHCSILVRTNLSEIIYESEIPLSRSIDIQEWAKTYNIVEIYKMPVKHEEALNAQIFLKSITGKHYSFLQNLLILIGRVFPKIAFYIKKISLNGSLFFHCSEFVALFQETFCNAVYLQTLDTVGLDEVDQMSRNIADYS
jgi:hypothetical protein